MKDAERVSGLQPVGNLDSYGEHELRCTWAFRNEVVKRLAGHVLHDNKAFIVGLAYLAHLMHIPEHYIIAMAIILFGVGIVTGVQATRHKDPS